MKNSDLVRERGVQTYERRVIRCHCGNPIPKEYPSHFCYDCDVLANPDNAGLWMIAGDP